MKVAQAKAGAGTRAVEARSVSFRHPGASRPALDGLTLAAEPGVITGLLGPNGAGKTTFVNLLCGLARPGAGELLVFGQPAHRAGRWIGYCPQELALYGSLSASENLRFFGRLAGLAGRRLTQRVEACLHLARLANEGRQRVEAFSGGMRRRLNLAVALVHTPRLVVLDEPTVGVDMPSRLAIFDSLEELREGGTAILYTTHYMEEVERLCRDVIVIDRGHVLADGRTREVLLEGRGAHAFELSLAPEADALTLAAEFRREGLEARFLDRGRLVVSGADLGGLLEAVTRRVAGGQVTGCETRRRTLEQRFLELTQRGAGA